METSLPSPSQKTAWWCSTNGSIIIEALVAIGLAGIVFSAGVSLLLTTRSVGARSLVRQEALWAAQEGIDALRTMSFEDLTTTESGGLAFAAEQWQMDGSPDTLPGGLLRTVRVRQVQRDASCLIVPVGTVDVDTLEIESEVGWTDVAGRTQQVLATGLVTRWDDPQGSCFEPTMANCFAIDVAGAEWFGGKQLREVYISNSCETDVTVSHITVTWNNARLLQQVFFGSSKVWSASGPGTPLGDQPSGVELDIANETISASQGLVEMQKTQFTGAMSGTTVDVTFTFTDGTTLITGPFTPAN